MKVFKVGKGHKSRTRSTVLVSRVVGLVHTGRTRNVSNVLIGKIDCRELYEVHE